MKFSGKRAGAGFQSVAASFLMPVMPEMANL
jgi:hypothetical protein